MFEADREGCAGLEGVTLNPEPAGTQRLLDADRRVRPRARITREALQAAFQEEGADARVFFHPLSSLPMFSPRPEHTLAAGTS